MRNRLGIILTAALVTGGLAAYLAFTVLRRPDPAADARAATVDVVDVVVAARDLQAGSVVRNNDVRLVEWPAGSLPEGFSRSASEVVGHGLLTSVKTNEPLLSGKLASRESGGGLPIQIPSGMRAMSVKVNEVVGVAGFVLPGTRVDVLVTLDQTARQEEPKTKVLLQNVTVAAAGQTTERDEEGSPQQVPVVTLLVNPAQAERLTLASTKGEIQLALRHPLDLDTVTTDGVRADRLIDDPPRPRVARSSAPRGPTRFNVDVYRGPDRTTSTVEDQPTGTNGSEGGN